MFCRRQLFSLFGGALWTAVLLGGLGFSGLAHTVQVGLRSPCFVSGKRCQLSLNSVLHLGLFLLSTTVQTGDEPGIDGNVGTLS